jgi:hypothetical protein
VLKNVTFNGTLGSIVATLGRVGQLARCELTPVDGPLLLVIVQRDVILVQDGRRDDHFEFVRVRVEVVHGELAHSLADRVDHNPARHSFIFIEYYFFDLTGLYFEFFFTLEFLVPDVLEHDGYVVDVEVAQNRVVQGLDVNVHRVVERSQKEVDLFLIDQKVNIVSLIILVQGAFFFLICLILML